MQHANITQTASQATAKSIFIPRVSSVKLLSWHSLLILGSQCIRGCLYPLAKRWDYKQVITKRETSFITSLKPKCQVWVIFSHNYIVAKGGTSIAMNSNITPDGRMFCQNRYSQFCKIAISISISICLYSCIYI